MKLTDQQLEQAAKQVVQALGRTPLPQEEPEVSPAFEAGMARLLKRQRWKKRLRTFARSAAAVVLVAVLLGGTVLTFDVEARAGVLSWCRKITEGRYSYTFSGDHTGETLPLMEITYLPEGYELYDESRNDEIHLLRYRKQRANSRYIDPMSLEYSWMQDGRATMVVDDDWHTLTHKEVTVNGLPADLYKSVSKTSTQEHRLLWMDEDLGVFFSLSTRLSEEETIAVAESVRQVK